VKSTNYEDPHYVISASLLLSPSFGPRIMLSTLFSTILNLSSSLRLRDQVPQPYKTGDRIIVLYF